MNCTKSRLYKLKMSNTSDQLFEATFFCTILRLVKYSHHCTERISSRLKQARMEWLNIVVGFGV